MGTKKQTQKKVRDKIEIENRRKKVAANILAGVTYREIADGLDVSVGTVSSDFKAIVKEWKKHYADDIDKWMAVQLRRMDVMINAIWANAKDGDKDSIELALKIMDRQIKLMGITHGFATEENKMVVEIKYADPGDDYA